MSRMSGLAINVRMFLEFDNGKPEAVVAGYEKVNALAKQLEDLGYQNMKVKHKVSSAYRRGVEDNSALLEEGEIDGE